MWSMVTCSGVAWTALGYTMDVRPADQRDEERNGESVSLFFIRLTALSATLKTTLSCCCFVCCCFFLNSSYRCGMRPHCDVQMCRVWNG